MKFRLSVKALCLSIVTSFTASSMAQVEPEATVAQSFAIDPSVLHTPASAPAKPRIALLLPESGSLFDAYNQPIIEGVEAENKQNGSPYDILPLPRKWGQSAMSHLQDAALMGAVAAIGPITRDAVKEVHDLEFLPLPTVALNQLTEATMVPAPELMMNFSLSQEEEAAQVAQMVLAALPEKTVKGEQPKVRIFEANSALEMRIATAFEAEFVKAGANYERVVLTPELMKHSRFYDIQSEIEPPELEPLPDQVEDPYGYQRIRLRNQRLMAEYQSLVAYEEPPYYAAVLVMDARTAAMVMPRLPRTTRVWGTSLVNPGNPSQGSLSSLAYDLQNIGFVDAPLVLHNNAQDFRASFGVNMPAKAMERRLFAFGVDAYRLALDWMHWKPQITIQGTTGNLHFDRLTDSVVHRQAQPASIRAGKLQTMTTQELQKPIERPE